MIPERVARRAALSYVEEGECHISTYSFASHGYAQIGWKDHGDRWVTTAHRAAWTFYSGEQIPEGMTIDHLCRNRACVRREHLRMLSNYENARRTDGREWPLGECAQGHSNDLLALYGKGTSWQRWRCSVCVQETRERANEARRARRATQKVS